MAGRSCGICRAAMVLQRADARYCSTLCRVTASRARKKAAQPPPIMRDSRRFVRVHATKRPLTVEGRSARSNDPSTWSTWAEASSSSAGVGVGYVTGSGVACFDFDDCLDERGRLLPHAVDVVSARLDGCIRLERSRSGRGLHVWLEASEAPGWRRTIDGQKVERYAGGQYVALGEPVAWSQLV